MGNRRGYLTHKIMDLFAAGGVEDRDERLEIYRFITWRPDIDSTKDLSDLELEAVADILDYWQRNQNFGEMAKLRLPS